MPISDNQPGVGVDPAQENGISRVDLARASASVRFQVSLRESVFFENHRRGNQRVSDEALAALIPAVKELSALYRSPEPALVIAKTPTGSAVYLVGAHAIEFCPTTKQRDLLRILHHEFNHIGQGKMIIAALLAFPEKHAKINFHPSMVKAVKDQHLQHQPLYVSIGEIYLKSRIMVQEANRRSSQTIDYDEYLWELNRYRNSFEELTANLASLAVETDELEKKQTEVREILDAMHKEATGGIIQRLKRVWREVQAHQIASAIQRDLPEMRKEMEAKQEELLQRLLNCHDEKIL